MTSSDERSATSACPKCAAIRREGDDTCPKCGVIYAKARVKDDCPAQAASSVPLPAAQAPAAVALTCARGAFLVVLAWYTFRLLIHPIASNYLGGTFLHLVNLPFHEAGHLLFSPFGRFLNVAGGRLMQLAVPVAVAASFLARRDRIGAAFGLWWLGESMADVAPYADDARAGQLPLLGGVTGSEVEDYHDWEIMLGKMGILSWDYAIGRFFFITGGIIMIAAVAFGALSTFRAGRQAR